MCKLLVLKENDEIDELEHYLILRQRKCEIANHGMSEQQVALSAGIIVFIFNQCNVQCCINENEYQWHYVDNGRDVCVFNDYVGLNVWNDKSNE